MTLSYTTGAFPIKEATAGKVSVFETISEFREI